MPILMYKGVNLSGSGMSASSSLDDASENSVATTKITNELNKSKAPLESPEFTGTPVVPTADKGISNTQIANTEYVQNEITEIKKSVSDGKTLVANAITEKGIETAADASFSTIAENISNIEVGVDTSDATATSERILAGETAYVNGEKVVGTLGTRSIVINVDRTNPTALSASRGELAGASVGDYALFAGGAVCTSQYSYSTYVSTVDAYNTSLVRSIPTELSQNRYQLCGASVGDYALFAGGRADSSSSNYYSSTVDAYNTSLVRSIPTELSAPTCTCGASVGDYALFPNNNANGVIDTYNSSLVKTTASSELYGNRGGFSSGSVGDYALFVGGRIPDGYTPYIDAYNSSLVRTRMGGPARSGMSNANVSNYALFVGGSYTPGQGGSAVAYNASLVGSTISEIYPYRSASGVGIDDIAIFAGGKVSGGTSSTTLTVYSSLLVRSNPTTVLSVARNPVSSRVGDYAIFAGGPYYDSDSNLQSTQSAVDAFTMTELEVINIPETTIYV